jgi:DNA-binding IscR family transcriptional regulator
LYVSARTDYAVRAMLSVAADHPQLVKAASLAAAQAVQAAIEGVVDRTTLAELSVPAVSSRSK